MDEFLKSIVCTGTDCLSWILVLFDILAIFYLVFCSFWKVTRIAKITGWVWSAGLIFGTVGVLIAHTCIYTLLTTVFTAMMIMAIMAVILPQQSETEEREGEKETEKLGSFLISRTDDERFAFAIYDASKKFIVNSKYSYTTIDQAKKEICLCRDGGMMAVINDKTGAWVREEYYPAFEMYAKEGKYHYCLKINGEYTVLDSIAYDDITACENALEKAKKMVTSTSVYLNTETVHGKDFVIYTTSAVEPVQPVVATESVVEELIAEQVVQEPEIEETVIERSDESESVVEEPIAEQVVQEPEIEDLTIEEVATTTVEEVEEEIPTAADLQIADQPVVDDTIIASEEFTVNGEVIYVTYNRSFTAKLIQASDEVKERYSAIKTALIEYGAKSRMSWANESFYTGRITVAKFGIRGKTLSLYLALDPSEYEETKYIYDSVSEVKKYAQTPLRMKIRSNRSVKWAKELIVDMMTKLGKEKKEVEPFIFSEPFKTTEELVYDKLIKVYTNGDGTETEVSAADFEALRREKFRQINSVKPQPAVEEVVEESELVRDVAEDGIEGGVVFTADKKMLWDKYAQLSKIQRRYFDGIRDHANDKYGVKCLEAKDYLTFKYVKDKLVRLRIRRDVVEAVFMLVGSSFRTAFSESEVKVKEAATIIRVENDAHFEVVLKTLDMQYDALVEERRAHKEERKAKRRQERRIARENLN